MGPLSQLTSELEALADPHELSSEDDLSIIAPVQPSGESHVDWPFVTQHPATASCMRARSRDGLIPHCVIGEFWDFGCVDGPSDVSMECSNFDMECST
ncbi:hypothetical protein V8E55_007465 [Tylopilus felleus]